MPADPNSVDAEKGMDALVARLGAGRAELHASLQGASMATLARPFVTAGGEESTLRELLWLAGALDDWTRLALDQGLGGRAIATRAPRPRPSYLETPELLRAWLDQTRGALLSRVRRVDGGDLERPLSLRDGSVATPRALLEFVADEDQRCAREARSMLRATEAGARAAR